jgi:DNA-binding NarL/FixJ family response regulator
MPIRIVLVDSHPIMRHGLAALLSLQPDVQVIAETSDCTDACAAIKTLQPDLVVFDLSLADAQGAEILHRFREHFARVRALVYTDDSRHDTVTAALDVNVDGYVLKASPAERLFDAVSAIAAGRCYLDPAITDIAVDYARARSGDRSTPVLTPRQDAILRMIGTGMANKEIAKALQISERTVKFHVSHILDRLKVRSRLQAAHAARGFPAAATSGVPPSGYRRAA